MTTPRSTEPQLTSSERTEFVNRMDAGEMVYALSVLAGLRPLVFDELAVMVGEVRAQRTRARVRAHAAEAGS